jgi:hypothetical protein
MRKSAQWIQNPSASFRQTVPECVLPPKQLEKLVTAAGTFLNHALVEAKHVKKAAAWELASATDISEVCQVISSWRLTLEISRTPQSARRQRKQPRTTPAIPLTLQTVFTPMPPRWTRPSLATPAPSRTYPGYHANPCHVRHHPIGQIYLLHILLQPIRFLTPPKHLHMMISLLVFAIRDLRTIIQLQVHLVDNYSAP